MGKKVKMKRTFSIKKLLGRSKKAKDKVNDSAESGSERMSMPMPPSIEQDLLFAPPPIDEDTMVPSSPCMRLADHESLYSLDNKEGQQTVSFGVSVV